MFNFFGSDGSVIQSDRFDWLTDASAKTTPPSVSHTFPRPLTDGAVGILKYKQPSITKGRLDIVAVTPWLAPIVWEGTFDPRLMDSIYKPQNLTIFATVFAVKYMWINKPTKVLSSRYMWQDFKLRKPELGIIRFSGVKKNYSEIRPNV
ncbi:unnamed protein product [Gadus morhua 'NCC']